MYQYAYYLSHKLSYKYINFALAKTINKTIRKVKALIL